MTGLWVLLGAIFGVLFFVSGCYAMYKVVVRYEGEIIAGKVKQQSPLNPVKPSYIYAKPADIDYEDEDD